MTTEIQTPVGAPPDAPGFVILKHFLVDLSVENPPGRLPDQYLREIRTDQGVNVVVASLPNGVYRVDIFVRLAAMAGLQTIFVIEMNYQAEVTLHLVAPEDAPEVLHVQVPDALLPIIREIFESNGRFAGYPELRLIGLDFASPFEAAKAGS